MEMEIKIAVPETGNIFDAEFSLSIVGMKVKNQEALKMLPDKIKQSLIDCVELESLSNLRFKSAAVGGRIDFVQKDFDKVISKIDFFIHYLDTYVD